MCKGIRVLGVQVVAQILASDVTMSNNLLITIQRLWGGIVGLLGIGEGTSLEVVNLDLNIEVSEGFNVVVVLWEDHDGRHHAVGWWDVSHHDTIAAASSVLLTVCECLAGTEVDEVVVRAIPELALSSIILILILELCFIRSGLDLARGDVTILTGGLRCGLKVGRVQGKIVIVVIVIATVIVIIIVVIVVIIIVIVVIVIASAVIVIIAAASLAIPIVLLAHRTLS